MNVATVLAGEQVVLDADRALYWPRLKTLVVADVHFGKAHVFRRAGIGIPRGSTSKDLARIDALVARHAAERLLVLGDFVHGPSRDDAPWAERVREWRRGRTQLVVQVVKGNHDRHFDARALGIDVVGEPSIERPFAFAHHPGATPGAYTLWLYAYETLKLPAPNTSNQSWRDVFNYTQVIRIGSAIDHPLGFDVPSLDDFVLPIAEIVPVQLLAAELAEQRGFVAGEFRHGTKVTTTE